MSHNLLALLNNELTNNKPANHKILELKKYDLTNLTAKDVSKLFVQIKQSTVKRELVSAIGKLRNLKFKPFLLQVLVNDDPKIVIQAIRALASMQDASILRELKKYQNHPNELVKNYLASLLDKQQQPKTNSKNKISNKTTQTSCDNRLKNAVINGDTLQIMQFIPANSVDLTFTSPPYYNARDYSIYPSYKDYLAFLAQVFKQIHRITAEGRFFVINTSPIIMPRASRQTSSKRYPIPFDIHPLIEQAGFEFIDDIIWLKPEACVKNRNGGFMQHRKPLGYKPNLVTEYVMVYRKQTNKLIDWNMRKYDLAAIENSKVYANYETTNVWKIEPASDKIHSAIFPPELCKRVIEFYSYVDDLVFDPFAGSGTVGKVALATKRNFLLTELNEDYFAHIKNNLSNLFAPNISFLSKVEFEKLW